MATLILVRHGRTTANADGVLAGRTDGVRLDAVGRQQAERTAERLAVVPLVTLVSSPLERCRQTSQVLLARQEHLRETQVDPALTECDYGRWQGRLISDLATEPLWPVVQNQPSAVVFPGGESLAAMQARAVAAVRRHDAVVETEQGPGAVWAAVSHGDLIKSVLADALGMHLDLFQRIDVGPASISIVRYGRSRPQVVTTNTEPGDLTWLRSTDAVTDAAPGGGAGHGASAPTGPATGS